MIMAIKLSRHESRVGVIERMRGAASEQRIGATRTERSVKN